MRFARHERQLWPLLATLLLCAPALPVRAGEAKKRAKLRARLLRDNAYVRRENPSAFARKLTEKMASSPFAYFRGTAKRFAHWMRDVDRDRPHVWGNGDVHPLNFGVVKPLADGALRFALNDQDEAFRAPYTWDLRRGGVGFELMARAQGYKKKARLRINETFVDAYLGTIGELRTSGPKPRLDSLRDEPPPLIRELIGIADQRDADRFYEKRLDENGAFRPRKRTEPLPKIDEEMRATYEGYLRSLTDRPEVAAELAGYRLTGVAEKETNGVGSMGYRRYLLALRREDGHGSPLILELKQQPPPALAEQLDRGELLRYETEAERVHRSRRAQMAGGERYDGHTTYRGISYQVMQDAPYDRDISDLDRDRLTESELGEIAKAAGTALAEAHLMWSQRPESESRELAEAIWHDAHRSSEALAHEIAHDARRLAKKTRRDHERFKRLLEDDAFGLEAD